jgi:hypothetical protein
VLSEQLERAWRERQRSSVIDAMTRLSDEGLMLGTVLASRTAPDVRSTPSARAIRTTWRRQTLQPTRLRTRPKASHPPHWLRLGERGGSRAVEHDPTKSPRNGVPRLLLGPPLRGGNGMTAEVAILNRTAVALAADSAVTIQVRGQLKIYNGADKLFQLSLSKPLGAMLFGGAEFVGIPLETIIKEYRKDRTGTSFDKVVDYAADFFAYLEKNVHCTPQSARDAIRAIIYAEFWIISRQIMNRAFAGIRPGNGAKAPSFQELIMQQTRSLIQDRMAELELLADNASLGRLTLKRVEAAYREDVDAVTEELFRWITEEDDKQSLRRLAALFLRKDEFSSSATGLVFAGFGDGEIFPTMVAFELDGMVCSRVKRRQTVLIDIDRKGTGAHIEPFAQKEMVERFLDGIDPDFDAYIKSSLDQILRDFSGELVDQLSKGSRKKKEMIKSLISPSIDEYLDKFNEMSKTRRKENFRQKVLDMVHFMPKAELASMAESLVNLTSIKRKVSAETETVGGPVDVAVISKGEGFVWIKRKHYFDRALNPRYILNQQQAMPQKGEAGGSHV